MRALCLEHGLKIYADLEPTILRTFDKLLSSKFFTENPLGRSMAKLVAKLLWFLPHGVVLDCETALKFVDVLDKIGSKIAVGSCICKVALNRRKDPLDVDVVILAGIKAWAERKPGYRYISSEELKRYLLEWNKIGLIHSVYACCRMGKLTFVICNCDPEICVPVRCYKTWRAALFKGPKVAVVDGSLCQGCGECVKVCAFEASSLQNGKAFVDEEKCMGCGVCLRFCKGNARKLVPREDYRWPRFMRKFMEEIEKVQKAS